MKKLLLFLLTLALLAPTALLAFAASDATDGVVWALDFTDGSADTSLLTYTNATAEVKDGVLAVNNTTNNPRLLCSGAGFELDAAKISEIRIKVKVPTGANQAKLFFAPKSGKYSEAACFKTQQLTPGEWQEIVFRTSERPNTWVGTIGQLRFDFNNAASGYELAYIRFIAGATEAAEPVDGVADGKGWTMDFSTLTDKDAPYFYGESAALRIADGALQVTTQGSNPRVIYYGTSLSVNAASVSEIRIKTKAPATASFFKLFFAAPGAKFTAEESYTVTNIKPGEWQEIVIETPTCAAWKNKISQIRLDYEGASGDYAIEYIKFIEGEGAVTPPSGGTDEENIPHADRWFTDKKEVTDYDYSFCVVGDTQVITERYPDKLAGIYDWILENIEDKKIEFVFGLGDIVQYGTDAEWDIAKDAISRLDGKIPYSLVRGSSNHDSPQGFNDRFGTEEYKSQFDGLYDESRIENTYRTFRAGNVDYLFVTLEFGPSDQVLEWASSVISAYPNHRVIITTHMFLYHDGTTLDYKDDAPAHKTEMGDGTTNNGDEIWEKLVSKHENIFMILCGHDASSTIVMRQTAGDHGNIVTQMLINPQGVDGGQTPSGLVAMLYFSKDGRSIEVEYYSTVRNMYYMPANQFTIKIPEYASAEETEETTAVTEATAVETTEALEVITTEASTVETTETPDVITTEAPTVETTEASAIETETEKKQETTKATSTNDTDAPSTHNGTKGGCGSSVAFGTIATIAITAATGIVSLKKRE